MATLKFCAKEIVEGQELGAKRFDGMHNFEARGVIRVEDYELHTL